MRSGSEDSRRCDAGRTEPPVDAFRAGPGAVPFADFLYTANLISRSAGYPASRPPRSSADGAQAAPIGEASRADRTLPRLADALPVDEADRRAANASPHAGTPIVRDVYLRPATTGRMIDVVI